MSCGCGDGNMIPLFPQTGGSGSSEFSKPTILIEGPGININDLSDADAYRFFIETVVFVDLTVALTMVAKRAGVTKTSPILKGTIIDTVQLSWAYNKTVATQNLSNTGGLTPPVLDPDNFITNYNSQNITNSISFTITGNDGAGQPGSIATDTEGVIFGEYMFLGEGPSKINTSTASIEAFIESLSKTIRTARQLSYFATGGVDQKHFVVYPKSWGLAEFTKGIFPGGYVRLKNVSGTLKVTLVDLEVETDVVITNEEGFAAAVYIYESLYDDQADAVTPFIIS